MEIKQSDKIITKLKAHAKINLFLHVGEKDEKGYHLLKTVFQPLLLHDEIIIKERNENGIKITSNAEIPLDEKNSVYKAIIKICEKTGLKIEELKYQIHIQKNIPIASGLGGSAVDAAPIIKFLNEYKKLGLSNSDMIEIGAKVGADVPQAMFSSATYAEGYGDKIIEEYSLPPRYVAIYVPKNYMVGYSKTATLYKMLDEEKAKYENCIDCAIKARLKLFKNALANKNWIEIGSLAYNDFELVVYNLYPNLREIKRSFINSGAECALLSGSGGAIFGIYNKRSQAVHALTEVIEMVGKENGTFILTETK